MPIFAKNMTVGVIKPAPTEKPKANNIKDYVKNKLEEKKEPPLVEKPLIVQPSQVTKQLPKYIAKEDGILTKKINTKSQYMRDIFELDS